MENEKKIKVVLLEPGKLARTAEIDASLAEMQKVVGGLIEPFYPFEEQVCIVCNDIRQAGLPVYSYKPMQVKQAVVGYGNATKHQVQDMTRRLLHLDALPKPDDAADAIAMALCHARSSTSLLAQAQQKARF